MAFMLYLNIVPQIGAFHRLEVITHQEHLSHGTSPRPSSITSPIFQLLLLSFRWTSLANCWDRGVAAPETFLLVFMVEGIASARMGAGLLFSVSKAGHQSS